MGEKKRRIAWIDMAKGYGMIFVILAHCDVGPIVKWICTFHMPLFFFLSGYVFSSKNDFITFLKKKSKSLLIPYFCLGVPMLIFEGVSRYYAGDYNKLSQFLRMIFKFLIQRRMWTLWFLACLFLLNILFYFTLKIFKTNIMLTSFAVISTVIGVVYYKYGGKPLPWNIDVCLTAYPFFYAGYYYKTKHEAFDKYLDNKSSSIILFVILGIINILSGYLTVKISGTGLDMHDSRYGCVPLTYISAFAGVICVIIVSKWFTVKPIKYIGENTLLYFAWHQIIMIPVATGILTLLHITIDAASSNLYFYFYKLLEVSIVIGLLTLCNIIVCKTKLKFVLGK